MLTVWPQLDSRLPVVVAAVAQLAVVLVVVLLQEVVLVVTHVHSTGAQAVTGALLLLVDCSSGDAPSHTLYITH
jgi:hypothetical protein